MADPYVTVDPPKREPRRGGIKAITGEFTPLARLGVAANIQYISNGCGWPSVAPGQCWGNVITGTKVLDGIDIEQGITSVFGQYAGVECYLGTGAGADYAMRAERQLRETEEHEIEAALIGWAEAGTASGTATGLTNAIALADQAGDQSYVGTPVIIMSRANAVKAKADGALEGDGKGAMWTVNGTPIISSWVAADNKITVIGWPTVYASPVVVTNAYNQSVNKEMAIAERLYAIAVDCLVRGVITFTAPAPMDPVDPVELALTIGTIPGSPIPDGTDTTVNVHANETPVDEVYLWYRINGGAWTDAGEMTQVTPTTFVYNVVGDDTGPGDSVDLYAKSGTTVSPTITVEIT